MNFGVMKNMVDKEMVEGMPQVTLKKDVCSACLVGKQAHIDVTEEGDGDEHQDHQHHEEQNNNEEEEAVDAGEQEQVAENNDANQDQHVTSRYGCNIRKPKRFDDYILPLKLKVADSSSPSMVNQKVTSKLQ